jgi:hypothetical protein
MVTAMWLHPALPPCTAIRLVHLRGLLERPDILTLATPHEQYRSLKRRLNDEIVVDPWRALPQIAPPIEQSSA